MRATTQSATVMAAVAAPALEPKTPDTLHGYSGGTGRVARLQISDVGKIEVTLIALGPRAGLDRPGHRSAGIAGLRHDSLGGDQREISD